MPDLTLYYFPGCPYCAKVIKYMKDHRIELPMKDTKSDPAIREELMSLAGKTQVPCLVIDGQPLHESDDIIFWLEKNVVDAK